MKSSITLKHIFENNYKYIGLKYFQNEEIDSIVKLLPNVKRSSEFNLPCIPYSKENLDLIYRVFKGIAWINGNHFFPHKRNPNNKVLIIPKRDKTRYPKDYRFCPDSYIQKLELKNYSINTAQTYISCFEKFIKLVEFIVLLKSLIFSVYISSCFSFSFILTSFDPISEFRSLRVF